MTSEPADESKLRDAIEHAMVSEAPQLARPLLARLWRRRPGPALAAFVCTRHERLRSSNAKSTRLFLLRSCTLEPVVPILRAQAFVGGIDLDVRIGDFNSHAQEILNPASVLYDQAVDVAILAVHTADVAPELWEGHASLADESERVVERVVSEFRNWISVFRSRSQAHLVIHDLELPLVVMQGILDDQSNAGQKESVRQINRALRGLAREYNGVHVLDYDGLVARHGRDHWHDERKWLSMRVPLRADRMIALASEWLRFLHPITGRVCKALVVDLDNTLWGGVIGEDGLAGIKLSNDQDGAPFRALQSAIHDLYRRGFILAICSKNNLADALEVIEKHPDMLLRTEHFAALRINWDDKAQNLRAIAKELNIGVDSLAFVDDNPAERALIEQHLPEVTVIHLPSDPHRYAQTLRECPAFEQLSLSAEDRERGRYYAEERQRSELRAEVVSLEDFYRSLSLRVSVARVRPQTLARTSQLTQKTNQFNLTTRRYNEQQIEAIALDPANRVYTIITSDRFGDNGLVGVVIVRFGPQSAEIDTLLLSCRVIGRTIETALLSVVASEARERGVTSLMGTFIPTKKNTPSSEFFAVHGFSKVNENAAESRWLLDLSSSLPSCPPWIDCRLSGSDAQHE